MLSEGPGCAGAPLLPDSVAALAVPESSGCSRYQAVPAPPPTASIPRTLQATTRATRRLRGAGAPESTSVRLPEDRLPRPLSGTATRPVTSPSAPTAAAVAPVRPPEVTPGPPVCDTAR